LFHASLFCHQLWMVDGFGKWHVDAKGLL